MSRSKPIIGIPLKRMANDDERPPCRRIAFLSNEIHNAIITAGGIPIGITGLPKQSVLPDDDWQPLLDDHLFATIIVPQLLLCDGILLAGGETSEVIEPAIARWAYDNDISCLGICAGQNNISRALGGTTKRVADPARHNSMDKYIHGTCPIEGTLFSGIVGTAPLRVNSRHKMTLDGIPDKLVISAFCDDRYPEAVEAPSRRFYLGVRFHPESLPDDPRHAAIFAAFVGACRR